MAIVISVHMLPTHIHESVHTARNVTTCILAYQYGIYYRQTCGHIAVVYGIHDLQVANIDMQLFCWLNTPFSLPYDH